MLNTTLRSSRTADLGLSVFACDDTRWSPLPLLPMVQLAKGEVSVYAIAVNGHTPGTPVWSPPN